MSAAKLVMAACVLVGAEATAQSRPANAPPLAREFAIDVGHSEVAFEIPFLYGKVRGRYDDVKGTIVLGEPAAAATVATVAVVIGAASISTGSAHRDEHLKSDDFFDVARFPVITFHGRASSQGGRSTLTGPLAMHGVTREITIPFTMGLKPTDDPHGTTVVNFRATLMLARKDFGIVGGDTHNPWFDKLRSATMGDSVRVTLEIHGWAVDPRHPDAQLAQALRRVDSLGVDSIVSRLRALRVQDSAAFAANAGGFDQVGRALLERGRTQDGFTLLHLVALSLPASAGAAVSVGVANEVMGDSARAITWYRSALALDSLNSRAMARLLRWALKL